ncbi:MAG: GNAT family N-acetyltransferase [Bacteroidales bacterium]|nr:GNAT family N-acetyltransferase [Bacteroidales bacterium]
MRNEKIPVIHTEDLTTLVNWRMEVLCNQCKEMTDAERERLESESRAYFLRQVPGGAHYAVLATPGGEAVGCGALNFYSAMPGPDNPNGACADIVNLYVRPEHRRQGIATAIVEHLKEIARRVGVTRLYLKTRDSALNIFAHEGFIPIDGIMTISVLK